MRDLEVLRGASPGTKSEVVGAIALHNLEMDFALFEEATAAWEQGLLNSFIRELRRRFPSVPDPRAPRLIPMGLGHPVRQRSPNDFDLRCMDWEPGPEKRVLLILPCSKKKPYPSSPSFRRVWNKIEEALGEHARAVQVVFLSGLYGPVPLELSWSGSPTDYDFMLHSFDKDGIARVAERLADFLRRMEGRFPVMLAYLPIPAYRQAARKARLASPNLVIFRRERDFPVLLGMMMGAITGDACPVTISRKE